MKRRVSEYLQKWITDDGRKPLIIRGARQVGKTWLVRDLARATGRNLVEVNFEKRPDLADCFDSNDPSRILEDLSAAIGQEATPGKSILFLDEIQASPMVLPKLRWFCEDMPELPVIAAGSLLEFVLADHDFSMPVGRISYLHVEPMSFMEYLEAVGEGLLARAIERAAADGRIVTSLHEKALGLFREYCIVGGMPEVVSDWAAKRSDASRREKQLSLLSTFRDDFNKYRKRVPEDVLRGVFRSVPEQIGGRFMYSRVGREFRQQTVKSGFDLLVMARVCHRVEAARHVGLPLSGETGGGVFKSVFMDTGLALASLGRGLVDLTGADAMTWNRGAVAEQVVGQLLRSSFAPYEEPSLHYWQKTGGGNAEIDYLVQCCGQVVPVEVKAGAAGSMKSLHSFMAKYSLPTAVRFDANPPSVQNVSVRTTTGEGVEYELKSFPLYMAELAVQ